MYYERMAIELIHKRKMFNRLMARIADGTCIDDAGYLYDDAALDVLMAEVDIMEGRVIRYNDYDLPVW
jgi:hypothetical protein